MIEGRTVKRYTNKYSDGWKIRSFNLHPKSLYKPNVKQPSSVSLLILIL